MKLAQFLKSRNPDHRNVIQRNISVLDFTITEVITLPSSSELFAFMEASIVDGTKIHAKQLGRIKIIGNWWCRDNCSGKYMMPSKSMTWAFELETDALMFKLTWC